MRGILVDSLSRAGDIFCLTRRDTVFQRSPGDLGLSWIWTLMEAYECVCFERKQDLKMGNNRCFSSATTSLQENRPTFCRHGSERSAECGIQTPRNLSLFSILYHRPTGGKNPAERRKCPQRCDHQHHHQISGWEDRLPVIGLLAGFWQP